MLTCLIGGHKRVCRHPCFREGGLNRSDPAAAPSVDPAADPSVASFAGEALCGRKQRQVERGPPLKPGVKSD